MTNFKKSFLSIGFLLISIVAFPWDAVGHRIIADIAYQNLTPDARKQCDKLLGKKGIIYYATWADEIRSDSRYKYSYPWHYQDLDDNLTNKELSSLLKNNTSEGKHLFYAIDLMEKRIKSNPDDAEALKFLVHFIGDLHQPLHLGRKGDLGGNKIIINWFGQKTKLHAIWDSKLIDSKKMSYSEYAEYLENKFEPQKKNFEKNNLLKSVEATYKLRNKVYDYDYSNLNEYHYIYYFSNDLDTALYRGGIQLARVLNSLYK